MLFSNHSKGGDSDVQFIWFRRRCDQGGMRKQPLKIPSRNTDHSTVCGGYRLEVGWVGWVKEEIERGIRKELF